MPKGLFFKGEIIKEEKFHVLGFVPAAEASLNKEVWFSKLYSEQISKVEQELDKLSSNLA